MATRRNMPLDGVKVIDLGQVYQGPYAAWLMAKAGADVIKIEPLTGEPVRQRNSVSRGAGAPFAMLNGHKRCITLDLKSPKGVAVLKRLARGADVLLENFAPGVMDRFGAGWSELSALNPRLIYASGTGYGLSGPDRDNLAMDITVQAVSGVMSVTGFPDGPPVKAGPALADFLSGTHLYAGIVTALYERQFTGVGRLVEVAMQETLFPTLASNLTFFYNNGATPPRTGNRHGGLAVAPYNVYAASDGHIAIIGVREAHWDNLLTAIGREDLRDDPRFATRTARVRNLEETDGLIAGWMKHLTRAEAGDILRRHKVPSAPVRDLVEVVNDPHMHARGMLEWIDHPEHGRIVLPGNPIRFHGADRLPGAISAQLGADTDAVLADELQMSEAEIAALRADGVIGPLPEQQPAGASPASSGK
ncbi:CaiB/BaiF CoA transferase family protein [Camelimonas lactis]|uniref:Crotonobetainyl-CoA:carnitine CoA-transferase CaiB-like acyl-CoA transferase n=1 Tax=Camelimonas lactis TaxID=659006 RepID=A0A4R2GS73_9HYPH|nr:CoA transferase [Camelimonas lactis]TCO13082.1 crotonobetainyl-CoA:carnitine CoA-transferase CaiB-like acyl-CoA transferase [Camelimonas lactis]